MKIYGRMLRINIYGKRMNRYSGTGMPVFVCTGRYGGLRAADGKKNMRPPDCKMAGVEKVTL